MNDADFIIRATCLQQMADAAAKSLDEGLLTHEQARSILRNIEARTILLLIQFEEVKNRKLN